ncbi:hypothetical protein NL676_010585 [Syzygium grande]|nr:hypothetical protein NL676_010585 [Syzygium grande]
MEFPGTKLGILRIRLPCRAPTPHARLLRPSSHSPNLSSASHGRAWGSGTRLQLRQSFRRFHQPTRRNSRAGKHRLDEEPRNPNRREPSRSLGTTLESLVDSLTSHTTTGLLMSVAKRDAQAIATVAIPWKGNNERRELSPSSLALSCRSRLQWRNSSKRENEEDKKKEEARTEVQMIPSS